MALTFLKIKILAQDFFSRLISTSKLSIYGKITSPEPLTEKRHPNHFTDPPPPEPEPQITVFILLHVKGMDSGSQYHHVIPWTGKISFTLVL